MSEVIRKPHLKVSLHGEVSIQQYCRRIVAGRKLRHAFVNFFEILARASTLVRMGAH
jgi:hypothetical protein